MAFSDGLVGQDLPRQYDDTNFDRVSQVGPAEGPAVADFAASEIFLRACISASVIFVTRQGYWTAPSPPVSWTAAGAKKVSVTNIPTGPSNVVQRLLAFTASGGANFYQRARHDDDQRQHHHFARRGFQRHDSALRRQHGLSLQPDRAARAARRGALTPSGFSGGANAPTWTTGAIFRSTAAGTRPAAAVRSAGSSTRLSAPAAAASPRTLCGATRYASLRDGVTAARGYISQSAITDANGNPLLLNNTDYSVRARVKRSGGLNCGHAAHQCLQSHAGQIGTGIAVAATQLTTAYQEFTADLFAPQPSLPSDLTLRVYADGMPSTKRRIVLRGLHRNLSHHRRAECFARARVRHRRAGSLRRRQRHHEHRRK